jgi:hypothetical protein
MSAKRITGPVFYEETIMMGISGRYCNGLRPTDRPRNALWALPTGFYNCEYCRACNGNDEQCLVKVVVHGYLVLPA